MLISKYNSNDFSSLDHLFVFGAQWIPWLSEFFLALNNTMVHVQTYLITYVSVAKGGSGIRSLEKGAVDQGRGQEKLRAMHRNDCIVVCMRFLLTINLKM